ncbi:hypothetical protein Q9Q95_07800 [Sphingomonas sp. DG1-23]|uniref:hypothetical protein n=1 Tax=Sphingomonas sp. DG1-23 TaxID=3068316 RepID=UPI00273F255D|nr:hypothetical protein [Sphingomonas sp. DG1-23]MDP5278823.1 hypothetical protein [Sphingomonas sp. DG1-23]
MLLRSGFTALLVLAAFPAHAQEDGPSEQTIVVTGTPLSKTEADLRDCLARKCPPREDIDASLAHAENQFVAGDYAGSRKTLAASRSRNARYAATLPVEVADLTRAYGRVSEHHGYGQAGRILQIDALDALKAGLEKGDSRVLMQRLMVGDTFGKQGRFRAAIDIYAKVAKQARKAGQPAVMGFAMLREAVLYGAASYSNPAYREGTERRIKAIEQTTEPELADFRFAARLLRARLASEQGDPQALETALAAFKDHKLDRPVLVFAPPLRLDRVLGHEDGRIPAPRNINRTSEWIDVRYRIAADGTVKDIETLRESPHFEGRWPKKVHQNLAERRYAPFTLATGSDGMTRIERFTMVYETYDPTGSRLRQRAAGGRIKSIDLTDDTPRPAVGQPPVGNP